MPPRKRAPHAELIMCDAFAPVGPSGDYRAYDLRRRGMQPGLLRQRPLRKGSVIARFERRVGGCLGASRAAPRPVARGSGANDRAHALWRCGLGKGRIFAVAGATSNPRASTLLSTAAGWEVYFSSSIRLRGMFAIGTQSPPSVRGGRSEPSALREKPRRFRSEQAKTLTAVGCFMRQSQNSSEGVRGSRRALKQEDAKAGAAATKAARVAGRIGEGTDTITLAPWVT